MPGQVSARRALLPGGWAEKVAIRFGEDGVITVVGPEGYDSSAAVGTLLPGMANVHTHSFQRAMAGLAEARGPDAEDDFWTWRKVMYRFLEVLTPDDVEEIAAQVQMDMALAGYTASAEFHYLHHQPGGGEYDDIAETAHRIMAASEASGIGLTMLPVLYTYGGLDARPLGGGQLRFGNDIERFERLYGALDSRAMPADFVLGAAPHSLRAVDREGLEACLALCPEGPIHIHVAEQVKEVEEVEAYLGARPVRWLLNNLRVDECWCLIHATHLDESEIAGLATSGAVAGLCPTTEANLGDGTFAADAYLTQGGRIGIGSDSNIRISVAEELRQLETSQRLKLRRRAVLTDEGERSTGVNLYRRAASGGAQAIGRNSGAIAPGRLADLIALRDDVPLLEWADPAQCVDAWVFGLEQPAVAEVWSAGRHIVAQSRHRNEDDIRRRFAKTMARLRAAL